MGALYELHDRQDALTTTIHTILQVQHHTIHMMYRYLYILTKCTT